MLSYEELYEHHGEIVSAYRTERNKAFLYRGGLQEIGEILKCAKNEDCDNCPMLAWCEELCDNKQQLIIVLEEVINSFSFNERKR